MNTTAKNSTSLLNLAVWKIAEVVIILVAGELLFWRYKSIFVGIEIAALFIGLVIISVLTLFIRQRKHRRIISLVLVTLMAIWPVGLAFYNTSEKTLFQNSVANPIPDSVRILESEYHRGTDPALYLHFKLSPDDFDLILRKRPYEKKSDVNGPKGPDWWNPQLLKNAMLYYYDPKQQPGCAVWLWVNEAKTEVYFAY